VFAQDKRDLSHGCVRLEDAQRLARWLLGKEPPAASAPEQNILLPQPVPITISYLDSQSQIRIAMLQ
jgi:murein L,D-transpeptidase YcbB/YkuD